MTATIDQRFDAHGPVGGVQYEHTIFTELTDPEAVTRVQLLHAEGYLSMGFVTPAALTLEGLSDAIIATGTHGRLVEELDHARGPQVQYHTSSEVGNPDNAATLREYNLSPGQTHEAIPAWQLSGHALTPANRMLVKNVSPTRLKEICALARGEHATPRATLAVIRGAIHNAIGNKDIWFSTLVTNSYESLVRRFGEANLEAVGHAVTIDDERVNPDLTLTPIFLRPDDFLDNLVTAYNWSDLRSAERRRFGESLLFFSDGLEPDKMSARVHATLPAVRHALVA